MAPKRDSKGRFLKGECGNKKGRPKKPYKEQLLAAIARWEKNQKGKLTFFDKYIEMAVVDPPTMRDVMQKLLPNLKVIEMPKDETGTRKYSFTFTEYDGRDNTDDDNDGD